MKIVAISDIHCRWKKITIPECDVLISAGDYSFKGEKHIVHDFHKWLGQQKAKRVISVQGNHEVHVEQDFETAKQIAMDACPNLDFLEEGLVEIDGVKFWGSAYTPWFHDWAYNVDRGEPIKKHWDRIPDDTDVLITHGPPAGILDVVYYVDGTPRERVGCEELWKRVLQLKHLKAHIFGHIHGSHGHQYHNGVQFYNASICDEMYMATNPITEFEISPSGTKYSEESK